MTKDGISIGNRKNLIDFCVKGFNTESTIIKNIEVNSRDYCACTIDKVYTDLFSYEIQEAINSNTLVDLLLNEKNIDKLLNCINNNSSMNNLFSDNLKSKKLCVDIILETPGLYGSWTKSMANQYCECIHKEIQNSGYSNTNVRGFMSESGIEFNEITIPCLNKVLDDGQKQKYPNKYVPDDIIGRQYLTAVTLLNYLGSGYKIKVTINGISRYFLFDTGASDLVINEELEYQLKATGGLDRWDYLGSAEFSLANNAPLIAKIAKIDNVEIGDYVVNNVNIAIIEEGTLLCGIGFLKKFSKWHLDQENELLILYR